MPTYPSRLEIYGAYAASFYGAVGLSFFCFLRGTSSGLSFFYN